MVIHVVAPTFREPELVPQFVEAWADLGRTDVRIRIVNGNPGDETSDWIRDYSGEIEVEEIKGAPELYWSGLTRLGLRRTLEEASDADLFVLTNIDVRIIGDPISSILEQFPDLNERQVTIPVVTQEGAVTSTGVEVVSWALSRNHHLWDGWRGEDLPDSETVSLTYLPTRFLCCSVEALGTAGFPNAESLPHYCADYEFTNRLRLAGYAPIAFSGARAELVEENTGFDTYLLDTSLWSRLRRLNDIKCAYNLRYRYRFVRLTYPLAAQVPGMISHFAKIFLEVLLGGRALQRWRSRS
ncbi:MAG: hypothetical protein AAGC68_05235 [Verrucomicrobiota bacterium]